MSPPIEDERLQRAADGHPYPLLFATISGSHLYGFESADSDFDLRGCHRLPLDRVVGLHTGPETIDRTAIDDGAEIDLVTHDAGKFFAMVLKKNGYVLEQIFSPLVVRTTPWHEELKAIAGDCITKHHANHYLGFARTQRRLLEKEQPPRVKPLLYLYRILLTGQHLMRTGRIEANLETLNDEAKLPQLPDLIALKRNGQEKQTLPDADLAFHHREIDRLTVELEAARESSRLPDGPQAKEALHDLLVRVRLDNG